MEGHFPPTDALSRLVKKLFTKVPGNSGLQSGFLSISESQKIPSSLWKTGPRWAISRSLTKITAISWLIHVSCFTFHYPSPFSHPFSFFFFFLNFLSIHHYLLQHLLLSLEPFPRTGTQMIAMGNQLFKLLCACWDVKWHIFSYPCSHYVTARRYLTLPWCITIKNPLLWCLNHLNTS